VLAGAALLTAIAFATGLLGAWIGAQRGWGATLQIAAHLTVLLFGSCFAIWGISRFSDGRRPD
jgi:hypothetical protein